MKRSIPETNPAPTLPELPEAPTAETVPAVEAPETNPVAPSVTDDGEVINWMDESAEPDEPEEIAGVSTVEGDVEVLDATVAPTEPTTTEPVTEAVPATTPVEPTPAAQAPDQTAQTTEPVPAVTEPQPPKAEPVTMSPEEALKWEQGEIDKLVPLYKLSDEEVLSIDSEPEVAFPKLAAVLHYKMTRALVATMQQMIPGMVDTHQAISKVQAQARTDFYTANPDLDKPEYEQAVLQVGEMYRKVNPNAPRAEAIKVIGEMARQALQQPALVPVTAPAGGEVPPVVIPSANVTPIVAEKPKPFTPARGGTGAMKPAAKNEWVELFAGEDD